MLNNFQPISSDYEIELSSRHRSHEMTLLSELIKLDKSIRQKERSAKTDFLFVDGGVNVLSWHRRARRAGENIKSRFRRPATLTRIPDWVDFTAHLIESLGM